MSDASSHRVVSDLENIHVSSSHSGVDDIGNHATTLLNDLSNESATGRVRTCTSNTFTTRTTCGTFSGSTTSVDRSKGLPVKRSGSGSVHSSEYERIISLSNRNHDPEPSVALPRRTETSSTKINKGRTLKMPAFTSPCPITLKGPCTRKRIQNSKETSLAELAMPSKNRRLITLQGSCQTRVRCGCNDAGQLLSDVKDGEGGECDTNCSNKTHKPEDKDCSTKPSATSENVVTQTGLSTFSSAALNGSEVNCNTSSSGASVPIDKTCESDDFIDLIQPDLGDSVGQMCGTRCRIENKNSEEYDSISSVVSNLNVTTKQRNCAQKENIENEVILEKEEDLCSVKGELYSDPTLMSVDKNGIHEGTIFSNMNWRCTFDVLLGKKVFINTRTGHSSFQAPCEFNSKDDECPGQIVPEANVIGKNYSQHLPHPCAFHLSFSCTPWLPREDRRRQKSLCDDGNDVLCSQGLYYMFIVRDTTCYK